ncbi:TPA: GNAT family N-acetyltransferase [Providencia rettgeri]
MYTIRLALPNDAQYLPAIEASAGLKFADNPKYHWVAEGDGQTEQDHLAFIHQQLEWIAVNDKNEPIGFINTEKHEGSLHICELSVCQNWQGKGVGKQLIKQVFTAALAMKMDSVTLTTFRDVPWNAPYYQYLGFNIIEDDKLSLELKGALQAEVEAGFAAQDRCAMIFPLV